MPELADVIIIGGGLAGLVAAAEIAQRGGRAVIVDQEGEQNLGGQAFWSLGGLFMVDTPLQRRLGIKDSHALALQDWMGSAQFHRPEDEWGRKWAEAYVQFAAQEKYRWLTGMGMRFFPLVGWAERGAGSASGHGNSVPRFHVTWGAGPGVVAPFEKKVRDYVQQGLITFRFRHRVTGFTQTNGRIDGIAGDVLEPSMVERGADSPQGIVGAFEIKGARIIITSGGIGGNHDLVRKNWPARLGKPPQFMVSGVPKHVDGRMLGLAEEAGAHLVNRDRMWHYVEGIRNWNPIWSSHGIRILPGPSSLWFDARGNRLPAPFYPGFDTLGTLQHIMGTGHDYSWFILNQRIIRKEFALSGSEQNPDLTNRDLSGIFQRMFSPKATPPIEAFKEHGADFVVRDTLDDLVAGMNALTGENLLDLAHIKAQIKDRDAQITNKVAKDLQVMAIRQYRNYLGDKLLRTVAAHEILDPKAGPLIAVKLNILTRKTLGGLQTNLDGRVLRADGTVLDDVYAAGEVAGFGGGGVHGYNALEGTFLGGCIFSGRNAGRAAVKG